MHTPSKIMSAENKTFCIIFVCTGNICRSPMAERLFAESLKQSGLPKGKVKVISAGVAASDGGPASRHSLEAIQENHIDLSDHKSQPLTQELIDGAAMLVCMTKRHRDIIRSRFDVKNTPVLLMRECMGGKQDPEVGDPFGYSLESYKACRDKILEAIPSLLEYFKKEVLNNENLH